MKSFKLLVYMIVFILVFTACSANTPATVPSPAPQAEAAQSTALPQNEASAPPAGAEATSTPRSETGAAGDIAQKTKDFILNGQDDRPEAGKLHWTEEFLNLVDMESLYQEYIASGLDADDVEGFAQYITENAPVPDNWKDMFEAAFAESYGETIVKYELIEDTYYQVYVSIDGSEVPYVAVNARTGYYHG